MSESGLVYTTEQIVEMIEKSRDEEYDRCEKAVEYADKHMRSVFKGELRKSAQMKMRAIKDVEKRMQHFYTLFQALENSLEDFRVGTKTIEDLAREHMRINPESPVPPGMLPRGSEGPSTSAHSQGPPRESSRILVRGDGLANPLAAQGTGAAGSADATVKEWASGQGDAAPSIPLPKTLGVGMGGPAPTANSGRQAGAFAAGQLDKLGGL